MQITRFAQNLLCSGLHAKIICGPVGYTRTCGCTVHQSGRCKGVLVMCTKTMQCTKCLCVLLSLQLCSKGDVAILSVIWSGAMCMSPLTFKSIPALDHTALLCPVVRTPHLQCLITGMSNKVDHASMTLRQCKHWHMPTTTH
jgi:hypothetical protein